MSSALAESLRSAIEAKAANWKVFIADSCGCGMNIVRIKLFFPRTEEECLPGFLASEFKKVQASDLRILHMSKDVVTEKEQPNKQTLDSNDITTGEGTSE
jgi:hypothetical protein